MCGNAVKRGVVTGPPTKEKGVKGSLLVGFTYLKKAARGWTQRIEKCHGKLN